VLTVQSEHHDTPDSADTCRRPAGKNNTGAPNTVEDRGNGGLALPAVHQFDVWDYPCPKGLVVQRLDCEPETPTARDSSAFTRRRMSIWSGHHPRSNTRATGQGPPRWLVSCRTRIPSEPREANPQLLDYRGEEIRRGGGVYRL